MKNYLKLMRVHHYIKNFLVFACIICSGQLFVGEKCISALFGFIAFCMISSVIYVINDICDVEKDRAHPTKKNRPIASGKVSKKRAIILVIVLFFIACACNFCVFNIYSTLLLLLYFGLNLGYSLGLKNIPILDITILVSGFLIRTLYGSIVTDVTISNWLYLTIIAGAFYFALGKRRNELTKVKSNKKRNVLKAYPVEFLDKNMYMCLTLANVFYALWSMDKNTIEHYGSEYLILSVPIVLLITMKYSLNIEKESDGDPIEVLMHDKVLIILCLIYFMLVFSILYL